MAGQFEHAQQLSGARGSCGLQAIRWVAWKTYGGSTERASSKSSAAPPSW